MSIDSTAPSQPAMPAPDPRALYLSALSVAEQIISGAPVVPQSITVSRYVAGPDEYGLQLHLARPTDVVAFARWIGAHVTTTQTDTKYPFETWAGGVWHGVPFRAWVMHSDAAWVQRQQDLAGSLAAHAHDVYDLDDDSAAVVPGCARVSYLAPAADAEVPA